MKSKAARILSFAFPLLALAVIAGAVIFEKQASRNVLVNISKRLAAEAGAAVSKVAYNDKGVNDIPFGPEGAGDPGLRVSALSGYIGKNFAQGKVSGTAASVPGGSQYAANFQYEDLSAPQLKALRDRYRFDGLLAGAKSEFERLIILRGWVRRAIPRGQPKDVDYNFNALDILERAGKGEKFFCSEYSTVFVQCALSLGITGRYVGLFKGHVVAEVWSDDHAKWAVMDVDNDLHYEKDGVPLDALELHDAWEKRDIAGIKAVKGTAREVLADADTENLMSYYHEFYVRMRNDWFSNRYPHWHRNGNSIMNGLEWQDGFTSDNILVSRQTRDRDELYFDLNTTSLFIAEEKSSKTRLFLVLRTFTPDFSGFLVRIDDNAAVETRGSELVWELHEGRNRLEVSAFNRLGVKGPPSTAEITI